MKMQRRQILWLSLSLNLVLAAAFCFIKNSRPNPDPPILSGSMHPEKASQIRSIPPDFHLQREEHFGTLNSPADVRQTGHPQKTAEATPGLMLAQSVAHENSRIPATTSTIEEKQGNVSQEPIAVQAPDRLQAGVVYYAEAPSPSARTLTSDLRPQEPGNSLVGQQSRVSVEKVVSSDTTQEIQVAITPQTNTGTSGSEGDSSGAFTHQEELFRAKWGWSAYDQARRAANTTFFASRGK